VIEENYTFFQRHLKMLHNAAGETPVLVNCSLSPKFKTSEATLSCFGAYYQEDVLGDPDGTSHQNIRNFMKTLGRNCILW
jgi:hypothetical protein